MTGSVARKEISPENTSGLIKGFELEQVLAYIPRARRADGASGTSESTNKARFA
jgi:hypothetical protein